MRNPSRIPKLLEAIKKYWEQYPDLRLGQIVVNMTEPGKDPFYLEDDELYARITKEQE